VLLLCQDHSIIKKQILMCPCFLSHLPKCKRSLERFSSVLLMQSLSVQHRMWVKWLTLSFADRYYNLEPKTTLATGDSVLPMLAATAERAN
jgi:hypothetical protein